MNSSRTRQAPAITLATAALLAVLLTAVSSATANPSINSKRAQAQAVLAQIEQSDVQLEKAIESYNYANVQLGQIDTDLHSNARHLVVAQKSLGAAQENIADRLKALYVNGDGGGAVEIILGAQNLDDLLGRLDMVQRVGDQDARVLGDVRQFGREVTQRRAKLKSARGRQAQIVAERASQKRSIESQLAERQRMLAGIQTEIKQLQAEEARRQAQLEAQARARLAAQQRAASASRAQVVELAVDDFTSATSTADYLTPTPPPPSQYGGVVGIAMQYLGTPYVWGGSSPGGFDCSGLVAYAYAQLGVSLPHNAAAMFSYGTPVSSSDLQAGDLVFFSGLGHMGIYIGGGQFIHAPHTGDVVKISNMADHGSYVGARRL
jgi:cell wall-associated NlpC family hydrolase/exonuclease VII small subunit